MKCNTFYCEGEYPVYELNINKDGSVLYNSIAFNKEEKGYYVGCLDSITRNELDEYFKQTNIDNLQAMYDEKEYADHPCSEFVFYMENDEVITTRDCSVSYHVDLLEKLYPIINNIKDSTKWVRKEDL